MDIYFKGRPDGMGNRVQELIQLDYFAEKFSHKIFYYWNISQKDKGVSKILGPVDYPCRFKCKNIQFVHDISNWKEDTFESSLYWKEYISYDRYPHNIQNIEYDFSIEHTKKPYIGIHTRSLDRIIQSMTLDDKYRGLSDADTYNYALEETLKYLNSQKNYEYLYICGDSSDEVLRIKELVNSRYKFIEYKNPENIEQYYVDMYLLSNSNEVVMASLFSSFAITAPILNNKPFITFFYNYETEVNRFPLNYVLKGKKHNPYKLINLSSLYKPFKVNSLIKLGKSFGQDYIIDEQSLLEANYLISSTSRKNLFFEEHFHLISKTKMIIFQKKILSKFFQELYQIIKFEKNRKEKIFSEFNLKKRFLSLSGYKFTKFLTFFIPLRYKINFLTKLLGKTFLFFEINSNNVKILKYLEGIGDNLTGLIIELVDYLSLKNELEEFINNFSHNICYIKFLENEGKLNLKISFSPSTLNEIENIIPTFIDNTDLNNIAVKISFT